MPKDAKNSKINVSVCHHDNSNNSWRPILKSFFPLIEQFRNYMKLCKFKQKIKGNDENI